MKIFLEKGLTDYQKVFNFLLIRITVSKPRVQHRQWPGASGQGDWPVAGPGKLQLSLYDIDAAAKLDYKSEQTLNACF